MNCLVKRDIYTPPPMLFFDSPPPFPYENFWPLNWCNPGILGVLTAKWPQVINLNFMLQNLPSVIFGWDQRHYIHLYLQSTIYALQKYIKKRLNMSISSNFSLHFVLLDSLSQTSCWLSDPSNSICFCFHTHRGSTGNLLHTFSKCKS